MKAGQIPFGILLGAVTLLFLYLLEPFFFPLFWAMVIAGIFKPLYRRIDERLRRPNLSTLIALPSLPCAYSSPSGLPGPWCSNNRWIFTKNWAPAPGGSISAPTGSAPDCRESLCGASGHRRGGLERQGGGGDPQHHQLSLHPPDRLDPEYPGSPRQVCHHVLSLFFFIRDGESLLNKAMQFSPLGGTKERQLYQSFLATARSTLR